MSINDLLNGKNVTLAMTQLTTKLQLNDTSHDKVAEEHVYPKQCNCNSYKEEWYLLSLLTVKNR